jgi:DNA gyrase subunit A
MQLPESGELVSASSVEDGDDVFLITSGSTLVRISVSEISTIGRSTKGVRVLRLKKGEVLVAAQVFSADIDVVDQEAE